MCINKYLYIQLYIYILLVTFFDVKVSSLHFAISNNGMSMVYQWHLYSHEHYQILPPEFDFLHLGLSNLHSVVVDCIFCYAYMQTEGITDISVFSQ